MTLKDLKLITRRFPRNAKIKLKAGEQLLEHFTIQLKYNSDEGWIVEIENDPQRPITVEQENK